MSHQFRKHVFVCTNERSADNPRGCCSSKNSLELLTRLKRTARAAGLNDVRINKAGCLDNCENGPSCVIYPEATCILCRMMMKGWIGFSSTLEVER